MCVWALGWQKVCYHAEMDADSHVLMQTNVCVCVCVCLCIAKVQANLFCFDCQLNWQLQSIFAVRLVRGDVCK